MKYAQLLVHALVLSIAGPVIASESSMTWERHTQGDCQEVFGGEVCTWSRERGTDLIEFGATIPMTTVENAPLEEEMVFPPVTLARVLLPEAVREATGVDHLGVNWEVHGHPPATFMTPHFDFHFYTIGGDEVEAIDCSDTRKPDLLPESYVLPDEVLPNGMTLVGICVPAMGMHALVEAEMAATTLFEASMVVGYYSQNLIFVEPMIARDTLLRRESFDIAVPAADSLNHGKLWPQSFRARFDDVAGAWHLVFTLPAME